MSGCILMLDANTLVALLAAGQSRRFGGSKLDADCAGKPLGAWAAHAIEEAKFAARIIVVPEDSPAFAQDLQGWRLVTNYATDHGLTESVRMAAREAQGHARLVIALADMPLIEPSHLRALATADCIAFTAYPDGGYGVPAGFPARAFATLASLKGSAAECDWGEEIVVFHPEKPQSLLDVDTRADLAEVERLVADH